MSVTHSFLDRSDEERLAERQRIKTAIAERKEREASLRSLELALRELDTQADVAADEHQRAAEPLQNELASPDVTPVRRTKLLVELTKLNDVLESKLASCKAIHKPLELQKRELLKHITSGAALEGSLARTAPLTVQCDAWAAQRGLKFATERLSAARDSHGIAVDELRRAESNPHRHDLIQFLRREGQWRAEVESAGRMLAAAKN